MKITKLEHSCLEILEGNDRLIIDPGAWSPAFTDFKRITALVVTHIHADHFDLEKIKAIIVANPKVPIYTTSQVASELPGSNAIVPEVGKPYEVGAFKLRFFGGKHAIIRPDFNRDENLGVLVNDKFYTPGDSYTQAEEADYECLAVPATAPWASFDKTAQYIEAARAKKVFFVHDGLLSEYGVQLYDRLISGACEASGKEYKPIRPGGTIEI